MIPFIRKKKPSVAVTLLQELVRFVDCLFTFSPNYCLCLFYDRRGGLISALSGREDRTLTPILTFLARYINDPAYTEVLIHVTHVLLGKR